MYLDRKRFYERIEHERNSKVIAYVTGDRPGLEAQIGADTPDIFLEIPAVKVFLNIESLAQNRYTTGSDEVQSEIRKLHELVSNIGAFSEVAQLELLNSIASSIGCESSIKIFDGNRKHGVWWFTSKAIQIYCKHQQETMTKEGESNE